MITLPHSFSAFPAISLGFTIYGVFAYWGFQTRMVYLNYITCFRYNILVRNLRYVTNFFFLPKWKPESTKTESDYLYSWIKRKQVTNAKILHKMVNPREKAGNTEEEESLKQKTGSINHEIKPENISILISSSLNPALTDKSKWLNTQQKVYTCRKIP